MAENAYDYSFYDAEAKKKFLDLSNDGMVSAFIYSDRFVKHGEAQPIGTSFGEKRVIAYSGIAYAPCEFFSRALGVSVTKDVSSDVKVNADGESFYPIIETAIQLGFCAKAYYSDRLVVIGKEDHIKRMDEAIATAAAYLTLGEYDPFSFKPDDYKAARQKWKRYLVGSPEINDLTNPTIKEKIDLISKQAKDFLARMNTADDRVILFGDKAPVESIELHRQYWGLQRIAVAYGTYGSELYGDEAARQAVVDGVKWMYENMYGEAEIEGRGWRDAHLFNWYFWFISAGEYLTDILFIMEEDFPLETRRKYLRCFDWCSTFMRHWFAREAALSRISVCTKVGLATENPKRLFEENVDFDMLLGLEEQAEGPRIDFSQWSHCMPYNNAYGTLNLDRILCTASCLSGTPVAFKSPKQYNQFLLVKYMFEAAMYKGRSFKAFMGRDVHYCELSKGGTILGDMMPMIGMYGEDEDFYVKRLIKRCCVEKKVYDGVISRASIEGCVVLNDLINDEKIPSDVEYIYAHSWYTADRAAQHGDGYAAVLALSSKREPAWESINSANKTGWHTGDGAVYLYTDYDKEAFDKDNFLMVNDNIAYNYPGTTEDERERTPRSIRYIRRYRSSNSFAGSVQLHDRYIVAGMDFISYNYEGPDDQPNDADGGGSPPIHLNDLRAKKAWFMLDGEIVCLGAGINSTMNSPVNTTVEHRRIVLADTDEQYLLGDLLPKCEYEKMHTGCGWFNMPGHAGFVFGEGSCVRIKRYIHEPAGNQSFINVSLLHGENPKDASYCYTVIPGADNEMLEKYAKNPEFKIISNDSSVQAVMSPKLEMTAFVFYAPAEREGVCASAPCIAVLEPARLTVCDPTQEAETLIITIPRELNVTEKAPNMEIDVSDGKTNITVNVKNAYGRSFVLKFDND